MCFSSDKNKNLDKIFKSLEKIEAQLHVFPEYSIGLPRDGLTEAYIKQNAEPLQGNFIFQILEKTRKLKTAAVFTTFLKEDQKIFNTAIFVQEGQVKALYKKIHLFDALGHKESDLFSAGDKISIATIKGFIVGLAICFDLRFPELFRAMAYKGVNLFVVPSAWYVGKYKKEQWQTLTTARAHENNAYLVAVNQTLPNFIGNSMITSPTATIIKQAKTKQTTILVEIDNEAVIESTKQIPTIKLSKPKLYKDL
ncbi:hypothetical protein E2P47_01845 [Candidatus Bathyarchaeota archaeon]|nr:hypothetical protein E2P47_01845 [Candidatus Bathyarchaeota archaeon]